MHQQHMCLLLLKVEQSAFTQASLVLVLVLLITGEGNQACYPIKYRINLINIINNIVPVII